MSRYPEAPTIRLRLLSSDLSQNSRYNWSKTLISHHRRLRCVWQQLLAVGFARFVDHPQVTLVLAQWGQGKAKIKTGLSGHVNSERISAF
ncbi:hypothetical protein MPTK1_2g25570 [Marchantia polymorpha subsp. ruderalis]|uniref:Uncharacterized protein n=1 Tax=Marchantia polymorpha TaxID=3197 RepID=A0A2R6XBN3_MARPO|nr:hypothetical protein MARPO_0025s0121 [Marchantia polymorpha]BBN03693.1 hypothetical protein Mp_2g25570 [Marchantia polymorpha subsp. ruderalis]|eukprot:PTQ43439.1 hypothetical protein MARPO_0025s0121 [Marchantia polymorpha]